MSKIDLNLPENLQLKKTNLLTLLFFILTPIMIFAHHFDNNEAVISANSSGMDVDCFGNITLSNQAAVDAFGPCTSWEGDITIEGEDIVSLETLSSLIEISGELTILNCSQLESLDGLQNLASVGDFTLLYADHLQQIDALNSLRTVTGNLVISGNPILENLDGLSDLIEVTNSLVISNNFSLENLNGLFGLRIIGGGVEISGNVELVNITILYSIDSISGSLSIQGNDHLQSITGLSDLDIVTSSVYITSNPQLHNLNGLSELQDIGGSLVIDNNDQLEDLNDLSNLATVGGNLVVTNNLNLNGCCGLFPLVDENGVIGSITIADNHDFCNSETQLLDFCTSGCGGDISLTSQAAVDAFGPCTYYDGSITIRGSAISDITDLSAFNELEVITGDLEIESNSELITLEGFNNLTTVGGDLKIFYNTQLTTINAFASLESAGTLEIIGNSILNNIQIQSNSFTVGNLHLIGMGALTNLDGFYGLRGLSFLYFNGLGLENVNGLSNLPANLLGTIKLEGNGSLHNLSGFSHFESINRLELASLAITSVDDFSNLQSVGSIRIDYNNFLENLNGLSNLQSANSIRIAGNEILSDCCGIYPALVATDAFLDVWGNPAFCSSSNDVRNFCSTTSCPGNVFLSSQAAVDAFDCQDIAGSIIIGGDTPSDIHDLTSLSGLRTIGGFLEIKNNPELTTLEGLDSLETIGGDLKISDNETLSECCVFYSLITNYHVGGTVTISGNPSACSSVLELVTTCAATLCSGDITLINQFEVDAFGTCTTYDGSITIEGNDIVDLSNLNNLQEITGDLSIKYCPDLVTMTAFTMLETVGGNLSILYNNELTLIDAFSNLQSVGGNFDLWGNPNLEDIVPFGRDYSTDRFAFGNNPLITNLEAFSELTEVNRLAIESNDLLENLDGLSNIPASLEAISLQHNESLQNLNGFSHINYVSDEVALINMGLVETLSPLSNLYYVGGNFAVAGNNHLLTLDGLSSLQSVGGYFQIQTNPLLNSCCSIYSLLKENGVDGNVIITDNPAFCGSEAAILTNCAPADYCESFADYPWHEWISKVQLNTIDNSSGKTKYKDFTSLSTTLQKGNTYPVSLQTTFSYTAYDAYYRIWIDYNQNGVFTDSGEEVFAGLLSGIQDGTPPVTIDGEVTIPTSALSGPTRMRIALQRESAPLPCGVIPFGEVEDYTVEISGVNPPVIQIDCPEDIYLSLEASQLGEPITWDLPTYSTTCPTTVVDLDQIGGLPNGSYFPVGIYQIVYKVTDDCANEATCHFTVYVSIEEENCVSEGEYPWHDWISRVRFGGIDNISGKSKYSDFIEVAGTVEKGVEYPISLTTSYSYDTYDEYWKVWIDYNQNNSFDEPEEIAFAGILNAPVDGTPAKTLTGEILIPTYALTGNTRMRVSMKRDAYATPCEVFPFGEVEDYWIQIDSAGNMVSVREKILFLDANLTETKVLLEWSAENTPRIDYFSVERSLDGYNFERIERVGRAANQAPYVYYQTEDGRPMVGKTYYRIKQYFVDGTSEISNVSVVDYAPGDDMMLVFPNPVQNNLYIEFNKMTGRSAVMQIHDIYGRLVLEKRIEAIPDFPIWIKVNELENGFYFINTKVEDLKMMSRKFIIER